MEFIHSVSSPATIAELDIFKLPPTQTVIESMYDVEYRPVGSITNSTTFEYVIPASEHYTDLAATYLHAKLIINTNAEAADKVIPVNNFAASLFEQLDVYLGTINITPGNSLFHYQTFIDDLMFKHKSPLDVCQMIDDNEQNRIARLKNKSEFDLIMTIHAPMFQQEKFLIDGIPITMRFKAPSTPFGLVCSKEKLTATIEWKKMSLFVRRVKLFAPVQMAIESNLAKAHAKYYFQRHEVKSFHLPNGFAASCIDNIYNGQLPRKVIVGFVPDMAFNGDLKSDPFAFKHANLINSELVVNGIKIPCSPFKPNFENKTYIRPFYLAFRSLNQDFGMPKINITYKDFETKYPFLVFDLTDDGTLASDSGALSLVKRGNVRIEIQFSKALEEGMHMIAFAIYDSVLQIDSSRNIFTDY